VLLETFLYAPDSSLLKQTVASQMLRLLNLAGFGLVAWDKESHMPELPFTYRSTQVAVFDRNLLHLSRKVRANAFVAHLRGVPYDSSVEISEQNLHPFIFEGQRLAMAHNGELASFREMRFDLLEHIRPAVASQIRGSTDSEWIYALIISALTETSDARQAPALLRAVVSALSTLRRVRDRHRVRLTSSVNLVACDGINLLATRFVFDFGCFDEAPPLLGGVEYPSQWYTVGRDYGFHDSEWKMVGGVAGANSIVVASEPLTRDISTWVEVPEYSALLVSETCGRLQAQVIALDV
jgi:glutamine amidotransferase